MRTVSTFPLQVRIDLASVKQFGKQFFLQPADWEWHMRLLWLNFNRMGCVFTSYRNRTILLNRKLMVFCIKYNIHTT